MVEIRQSTLQQGGRGSETSNLYYSFIVHKDLDLSPFTSRSHEPEYISIILILHDFSSTNLQVIVINNYMYANKLMVSSM